MTITPYGNAPLTEAETADLTHLEEVIAQGIQTFYMTGAALATVRDNRLYRTTHATFEGYCGERWDLTSRTVYRIIAAAGVAENVTHGSQRPPANERQARPLTALSAEDQPRVWQAVEDAAGDSPITTAIVEREVERFRRVESQPTPYDLTERDPEPEPTAPAPVVLHADAVIIPLRPNRLSQAEIEAAQPGFDAFIRDPDGRSDYLHQSFKNVLSGLRSVRDEVRSTLRNTTPSEMAAILTEDEFAKVMEFMPSVAWIQAVSSARQGETGIRRVK